ncbi:GFA family protein [Salinisphaera sp. Q1T1-3]|uniref:GFA family protein n=1 Tax=Salinisphaera sp. Q1T1-3 TaxID=2321229 RepID=UPI000E722AA0|nr:GFA family protein [Salinisphaera sp. Q1T1-3]RJS91935.1 aldehyde-activating protein [Salinisphaera sp. Q1T1-3]
MPNHDTLAGSCLCGAVHYRVTTVVEAFYYCECAQCRKLTGAVAAANLRCAPAPLAWLRGAAARRTFRAADGRDFSRVFCLTCGSALPWYNRDATALLIPAGSLDTPPPRNIESRIFSAERPSWATMADGLPAHDAFDPG